MGNRAKHVHSSERRAIRREVIARDGLVCWICKRPIASAKEVTMDHVRPVHFGGMYEASNLHPAHADCNQHRAHGPPPRALPSESADSKNST